MTPSRIEHSLLLSAAQFVVGGPDSRCSAPDGPVDWPYLLGLAQDHGMGPLLHGLLARLPAGSVPEETARRLRHGYYVRGEGNARVTEELLDLLAALQARGIAAVPLRGPALAHRAYGDPALRPFGDLDLLVAEPDAWKACDLVLERGHTPFEPVGDRARFLRTHDQLMLTAPPGWDRVPVEIHWRLAPAECPGARIGLSDLHIEPATLSGKPAPGLAPEDLLIVLCVHGAQHAWNRLIWICDVAALLRVEPRADADLLRRRAESLGCARVVTVGLALTRRLFPTLAGRIAERCNNDPQAERVAERILDRLFRPQGNALREKLETDRLRLAMADSWALRAACLRHLIPAYLRQALVPNENDRRLVPLPPALSFAYYLVKPFRLAATYLPGRGRREARESEEELPAEHTE